MLSFRLPGHLFDLNSLTREGGYTVFAEQDDRKMFYVNICGNVSNVGCSPETGIHSFLCFGTLLAGEGCTFNTATSVVAVCIKDASTVTSGGQASRKLTYKDHVVELTYEGGSPCPANPELKHSTAIHFVCRYLPPLRSLGRCHAAV